MVLQTHIMPINLVRDYLSESHVALKNQSLLAL